MTSNDMYQAVLENNESYDGVFFYAVKSTGIYCRPSCKSRTPKKENIEYFQTAKQAQEAGYRACKRCKSDLADYKPMKNIAKKLKNFMDDDFAESIRLNVKMNNMGLSRKRIVEIFKKEYGITPSCYISELRLAEAKKLLEKSNDEIVTIAFAVGFGSLSTFYKFFKQRTGTSPAAYRNEKRN